MSTTSTISEATISEANISEDTGGVGSVMRRGIGLSEEFLRGIAATAVLGLVAVVGRVALPIAVQQALDHATSPGDSTGAVVWPVAGAAIAVTVTAITSYWVSVRLYRSSEAGLAATRVSAFRHIHGLSLVTQEAEPRGALVARVTSDIDTISGFLQYKGLMLALSALQMVTTTVVMACYDVRLTLLVWAFQLPLILFLGRTQKALARLFGRLQNRVATLLGVTSETLMGAETIRAHSAQSYAVARADEAIEDVHAAQLRCQWGTTTAQTVAELVPCLITVALVVVGARLTGGSGLTVGDLTAFLFLAVLFVTPTRMGVTAFTEAQRALSGWRRLLGVLAMRTQAPDDGTATVVLGPDPAGIHFEGVSFRYPGGRPVLHELSVAIEPGQRVAIVGETGSGKTTFAKLACGLVRPSGGRVLVGGVAVDRIDQASLRQRVVIVPQEGFLFDTTIAENIRFGVPDASDARIERAFRELGLREWLESLPLGLGTRVGRQGGSLSAGERQLVALVRAHAADPAVLILDEATSAVDPATEDRIQQALERLTRGRTALVVAHRLVSAQSADTVLVFDAGRIVEAGSHSDLLARDGSYAALHDAWITRPQYA
ncbi:ABC transporter ATP-binding protein [Streptacidiphilus sp. P02-A3a]|uniref:ABC transporter ATP-binding protein n=1 Tax=Streptacidiphilus sp. P02-A3a TaxID=2704468 RepID=UPI0015FD2444|nr:ABC transporter ATP-binding protein [Streptacidiphilus sp. P02-A3a]QMU67377.1 ABC transporter ATP-binding protein [Streptacidiphilus sp. P02-A3a]